MIVRAHVFFLEIRCAHSALCLSARLSLEMDSLFEGFGVHCGPVKCKNGMIGWLVDGQFVGGGYAFLQDRVDWLLLGRPCGRVLLGWPRGRVFSNFLFFVNLLRQHEPWWMTNFKTCL